MPHLIWPDNLDTGIKSIDAQHRRIVDYINMLHDSRIASDRTVSEQVIDALLGYIITHFDFEEELMEEAGYESIALHRKAHEAFVGRIGTLQRRFKGGEAVMDELLRQLTQWNMAHIRDDDAGYVDSVLPKIHPRGETDSHTSWISNSLGQFFHTE